MRELSVIEKYRVAGGVEYDVDGTCYAGACFEFKDRMLMILGTFASVGIPLYKDELGLSTGKALAYGWMTFILTVGYGVYVTPKLES